MKWELVRIFWSFTFLFWIVACVAQDRDENAARSVREGLPASCSTYHQTSYTLLYEARDFSSESAAAASNETIPDAVLALRCLVQEPNAVSRLSDLATRGSVAGQLYALVGLRALDRSEFDRHVQPLLSNQSRIQIVGEHQDASSSVAAVAAAIGYGRSVREFLPSLQHLVPEVNPAGYITEPQ